MKIQIDDLVREATVEEIAIIEQMQAESVARKAAEIEAEAKRSAAIAKLAILGLDEDDLKVLGLG